MLIARILFAVLADEFGGNSAASITPPFRWSTLRRYVDDDIGAPPHCAAGAIQNISASATR
ncbi:hypothetical protein KCP73_08760 [Salmonella enterica subsp. enterica]|nr:hypothetical protein KCP73_08760 [Salmonella enterica subsp. enterica]